MWLVVFVYDTVNSVIYLDYRISMGEYRLNLISQLDNKDDTFTLKYYGPNDFATGWDITMILDNIEKVESYFTINKLEEIDSIEDFLDYLTRNKIIVMREIIPNIKTQENQRLFEELVDKLEKKLDSIPKGQIIRFINESYKELFDEKYRKFGLIDVVMEYILKFQNGIHDSVFFFIIENYSFLIVDNYVNLQKKIEKDTELFKKLFSLDGLDKIYRYRSTELLDIVSSTYRRSSGKNKASLDVLIEKLVTDAENIMPNLTVANVVQHESNIRLIYSFLQSINHVKSNIFSQFVKTTKDLLDKYIVTNGQVHSYEIPVDLIIDALKNEPTKEMKLLRLTHFLNSETNEVESMLNCRSEGKNGLLDEVSSNIASDDYFTRSHQQKLEIQISVGSATLFSILHHSELLQESYEWYSEYISLICEKLYYDEIDLNDDLSLLYKMIDNMLEAEQKEDELLIQSLSYGACMFICAFSEKILRIVYYELLKDEIYIPNNSVTMGSLLTDTNGKIIEILGENQVKHLRYYFGTYGENKIGFNYRNGIAHWSEYSRNDMNFNMFSKLLFLFTNITNSLVVYFTSE